MHGVADGAGRSRALRLVSAASLAGRAPPARAWLVPEVIPAGATTLLSGDGGTGKSLLALMLAASVARGASWLGRPTERGPALVVSAEDCEGELHRRLADISRAEGFDLRALSGLRLAALDGETILAARRSDGTLGATPLFAALEAAALPLRPRLIVLDTAAALFGGEEINRRDVQSFISMLNGLARSCGAAVLLISHPSRAGLAAGDGLSGSTGWSNAVRPARGHHGRALPYPPPRAEAAPGARSGGRRGAGGRAGPLPPPLGTVSRTPLGRRKGGPGLGRFSVFRNHGWIWKIQPNLSLLERFSPLN